MSGQNGQKYLPSHNSRQKWYKEEPKTDENDFSKTIDHRGKRGFYRHRKTKECYYGNDSNVRYSAFFPVRKRFEANSQNFPSTR